MRCSGIVWILICAVPLTGFQDATRVREYRIGPMDLLEITVFELPALNQTVRVSEDGTITLALLGKVEVGGKTKDEIEIDLRRLLQEKKYVIDAEISVFIKEYQSQQVNLIGAVREPGPYELIGRKTLLQMISQAGGFSESAGRELFILREGQTGDPASIRIDLDELLLEGNQELNIPLQANDIVNIPVDKTIKVYVFGKVKRPGAIEIKKSEGISIVQAIAEAGGPDEGADRSNVLLKRKDGEGEEVQIRVNLKKIIRGKEPDIELRAGDTIYVPESIW